MEGFCCDDDVNDDDDDDTNNNNNGNINGNNNGNNNGNSNYNKYSKYKRTVRTKERGIGSSIDPIDDFLDGAFHNQVDDNDDIDNIDNNNDNNGDGYGGKKEDYSKHHYKGKSIDSNDDVVGTIAIKNNTTDIDIDITTDVEVVESITNTIHDDNNSDIITKPNRISQDQHEKSTTPKATPTTKSPPTTKSTSTTKSSKKTTTPSCCPRHRHPCRLLTVKKAKTGNKGLKFYVCSMPQGERYDFF